MDFIKQFRAAQRVSTPLLCIRTFDAKSTINLIRKSLTPAELERTGLLSHDCVHGIVPINGTPATSAAAKLVCTPEGQEMTIPVASALRLLEHDELQETFIFIANAHMHWKNDPSVIQGIWNLRGSYKANGNMLILLTTPGATLPDELVSDVFVLDEPLPTTDELGEIVRGMYKSAASPDSVTDTIVAKATDALIGLPAFAAEQATAMCLEITKKADKDKANGTAVLNISDLWERKRTLINQTPGLTVYSGKETLDDIGGIESVKQFFVALMSGDNAPNVILWLDEMEKAFAGTGTDLSGTKTELTGGMLSWMQDNTILGSLLLGIPGVSKSFFIKCLGNTFGVPVIRFDVAAMQDSLVGSSGARLRGAQKIIDATSGGRVHAIATCNGIGSIPPELRRRFSFSEFFFDAPNRKEKDAIWKIHRAKQRIPAEEPNPADEGWTGAEIEKCCVKAHMLKWTLAQSAGYIIPITKSSAHTIAQTRMDASGKYLSASVPGEYVHTETQVIAAPKRFTDDTGRRMRD